MDDEHSPNLDFDADDGSDSDSDAERYSDWVTFPSRVYPFEVELTDEYVIEIPDEGVHRVLDLCIQFRGEDGDVDEKRAAEEGSDGEIIDDDLVSTVPSPYSSSPDDSQLSGED